MVEQTIYQNGESDRKQLKMPKYAYQWLKSDDGDSMTKGLNAFEALFFANEEYTDSLTETENFVDSQLSSIASVKTVRALQKIKKSDLVVDTENDEMQAHVNVHLPQDFVNNQLKVQRGIGEHIADAVVNLAESAYTDRLDRIKCKREIYQYIDDGTYPSHPVAQAVVEGDNSRFEGVMTAYDFVSAYSDEDDGLQVHDDLTLDDLRSVEHSSDGAGFSQGDGKEDRVEAIQIALENEIEKDGIDPTHYTSNQVAEIVSNIYGIKTDATVESYVDDLDIHWVTMVDFNAREVVLQYKKDKIDEIENADTRNKQTKLNKLKNTSASDLVLKDDEYIEDTELPAEVALEQWNAILDATNSSLRKSGIGSIQWDLHEKFETYVQNMKMAPLENMVEQN
ncbi:hypothetical protein Har1130_03610 [Haloarcula sp. CBA1130]|nr:hypothetical protein Har1129_01120 [Haloarcula sp. CBA1129]KAA9401873.1 hypothetical protein Har1130_03610 [Haloarcula sp. CBA1130]